MNEKILIVDDHPLVREGMKEMLQSEGFAVETAAGGADALARLDAAAPGLVITDIRMPGMDGFDFAAQVRRRAPAVKVLMLAGMPLSHEVARAKESGAAGYLPKATPWRKLVAAIRAVLAGAPFQEETFAEEPPRGPLTPREMEVLRYMSLGKTQEEIGIILGLGVETVKTYFKGIRTKLDAPSAAGAVGRAYELGLLQP